MRISFRTKLSFAGLILSVIISAVFGFTIYKISYQMFFDSFLKSKLTLAKILASSIDGDKHESFISRDALNDREYWRYMNYFRNVFKEEDYMTWLGSFNYVRDKDTFYYCIDCDEVLKDTIWIESDKFSFQMNIDSGNKIVLIYDEKEYRDKFTYNDGVNEYIISINGKDILLNDIKILEVISYEPLTVLTEAGEVSNKIIKNNQNAGYQLFGKIFDLYFTFSKKGDPSSLPGDMYIESKDKIISLKKIIQNKIDFIEKKPVMTTYGKLITAYAIINNTKNEAIGLISIDINTKQLNLFNKQIFYVVLLISIATLIIVFILSLFLSQYIIKPLKHLLTNVRKVSDGNYEVEIILKRSDEFGSLAEHFNLMVHNIKKSRDELFKTNEAYYRFVPKDFLNFLKKSSIIDIKLGDQVQRKMTILFSDIRSFTSLSESMTPVENFNFVNSYLEKMGPVIRSNNGFIDKYIGDAIMALFPENADDAVNAAIMMLVRLREYNIGRGKSGYKKINIGIGIHTGNLMLGTVGERERMDSTVISDAVNLSSRLEGLTKKYHTTIIISEDTLNLLQVKHNVRFVDRVQVVGKQKPINIYEIYDYDAEELKNNKDKSLMYYNKAIDAFYKKQINEAKVYFSKLSGKYPEDELYLKYLERCNGLSSKASIDDKDIITSMEEK